MGKPYDPAKIAERRRILDARLTPHDLATRDRVQAVFASFEHSLIGVRASTEAQLDAALRIVLDGPGESA